jgi:hypothetical protein
MNEFYTVNKTERTTAATTITMDSALSRRSRIKIVISGPLTDDPPTPLELRLVDEIYTLMIGHSARLSRGLRYSSSAQSHSDDHLPNAVNQAEKKPIMCQQYRCTAPSTHYGPGTSMYRFCDEHGHPKAKAKAAPKKPAARKGAKTNARKSK